MAVALAAALVLGCVGILFGSSEAGRRRHTRLRNRARSSHRSAIRQSTSTARVRANPLVTRLNDGHQEPYTAGSAFDASGNFYVTDDYQRETSVNSPPMAPSMAMFASGLQNPLSLAFDNQGNLYVGQQTTPYIAEFAQDGPAGAEHRTAGDRAHRRRLDRARHRRVHLLLHHRRNRHSALQHVHEPRRSRISTSSPSRPSTRRRDSRFRHSNSRSSPTATSSWQTRMRTSSWTRTGT